MGYAIVKGDLFNTHSSMLTMLFSEAQRTFALPRLVKTGPTTDIPEVNMGEDMMIAAPGDTITPIRKEEVNPYLASVADLVSRDIQSSTVSNVLFGGQVPAGTAFETLNLLTQTALGQLKPSKRLTEQALAEIATIFCLWAKHTGVSLDAMGTEERGDLGKMYSIPYDEIDPNKLYISVEMDTFSPSSEGMKANAALMKRQLGGYSLESALEDVGVTDPQREMRRAEFEMLKQAELQNAIQIKQAMQQMQLQQAQQQAQMAMQQQQQEAQMMAQQQQMMGPVPGGQGFNPAMGGQSPVGAGAPEEMMREEVQGQTRGGMPLAAQELGL